MLTLLHKLCNWHAESLWAKSRLTAIHSYLNSAQSWLQFLGLCMSIHILWIDHSLRPSKISEPFHYHSCPVTWCSIKVENAQITTKLLQGRREKLLFQNVLIPFFIYGSVLGRIVREPTHEWSQDASLFAHTGGDHVFFSGQSIFQMSQTVGRGLQQRK